VLKGVREEVKAVLAKKRMQVKTDLSTLDFGALKNDSLEVAISRIYSVGLYEEFKKANEALLMGDTSADEFEKNFEAIQNQFQNQFQSKLKKT
jgi:hypothetical protein